ncbi:DUF3328 domain containing protein [Pyrenophora tritici-repentis]|nr:DUF3328 domain containing protein [Pyrenophora tritici-repentis]
MNDFHPKAEFADDPSEEKSLLQHRRQESRRCRSLFALAHLGITATLLITTVVCLSMLARGTPACDTQSGSYDPFIPPNILQDTEVFNYGYYVRETLPPDTFKNISIMEQRLTEIGLFHMSTAVKVNGDYRSWIDDDGAEKKLYPKITLDGEEMATIRDYGYLINGYKPKWTDAHILHCFNKFYNTIACLADSVVEGYKDPQDPSGIPKGEIRRASEMFDQPQCRNYDSLKQWAAHPSRSVPFYYNSGHDESKEPLPERCDVSRCRTSDGWMDE